MGGGMKSAPMPMPQPDPVIDDKVAESEAKLEAERQRMISLGKQGSYGTLLTSGEAVKEEAPVAQTLVGSSIANILDSMHIAMNKLNLEIIFILLFFANL